MVAAVGREQAAAAAGAVRVAAVVEAAGAVGEAVGATVVAKVAVKVAKMVQEQRAVVMVLLVAAKKETKVATAAQSQRTWPQPRDIRKPARRWRRSPLATPQLQAVRLPPSRALQAGTIVATAPVVAHVRGVRVASVFESPVANASGSS